MADEITDRTTAVTRRNKEKGSDIGQALISFTAVTTHQAMAEAFVKELIRLGKHIIPDRELSIGNLITICHTALNQDDVGVAMFEGRHLRGRIGEQISRAERYKETFSIIVIQLKSIGGAVEYDAVVDTLCERLRKIDLMFTFKQRVVLVLPHTNKDACETLVSRIDDLFSSTIDIKLELIHSTYPSERFSKGADILDWTEDQIRAPVPS